jgi:hypothetical protein
MYHYDCYHRHTDPLGIDLHHNDKNQVFNWIYHIALATLKGLTQILVLNNSGIYTSLNCNLEDMISLQYQRLNMWHPYITSISDFILQRSNSNEELSWKLGCYTSCNQLLCLGRTWVRYHLSQQCIWVSFSILPKSLFMISNWQEKLALCILLGEQWRSPGHASF